MTAPEDPWIQMKFRVRASLHARLEEEAGRNGYSLNAEIARRLADSFVTVTPDVMGAYQELVFVLADLNILQSTVFGLVGETNKEKAVARVIQVSQEFVPLQGKLARALNTLMPRPANKGRDQ